MNKWNFLFDWRMNEDSFVGRREYALILIRHVPMLDSELSANLKLHKSVKLKSENVKICDFIIIRVAWYCNRKGFQLNKREDFRLVPDLKYGAEFKQWRALAYNVNGWDIR